jgi:hypothetical protein
MDYLNLSEFSEADLERAKARWVQRGEGRTNEEDQYSIAPVDDFYPVYYAQSTILRVYHWDTVLQLGIYPDEQAIRINFTYINKKNKPVEREYEWPLDSLPKDPAAIWSKSFYRDRALKKIIERREWMLEHFQNFIYAFSVPERDGIHEVIGYDS